MHRPETTAAGNVPRVGTTILLGRKSEHHARRDMGVISLFRERPQVDRQPGRDCLGCHRLPVYLVGGGN